MSADNIISKCCVFKGLDGALNGSVEAISRVVIVPKGEKIFSSGDKAEYLYAIGEGKVGLYLSVSIMMSEREILFDEKGESDLIGWSALVPPHELTMSAYATEDCCLLRIPGKELQKLCQSDPKLGSVIMSRVVRNIGNRLVQMEKMLAREIELGVPA